MMGNVFKLPTIYRDGASEGFRVTDIASWLINSCQRNGDCIAMTRDSCGEDDVTYIDHVERLEIAQER